MAGFKFGGRNAGWQFWRDKRPRLTLVSSMIFKYSLSPLPCRAHVARPMTVAVVAILLYDQGTDAHEAIDGTMHANSNSTAD